MSDKETQACITFGLLMAILIILAIAIIGS
jgi:hypothetical protein